MDGLPAKYSIRFPPVEEAENGQKLLRHLTRRLGLPETLLHRWLRTGQIRLNGRRAKPFERVLTGDLVRLPPFVASLVPAIALESASENGAALRENPDFPLLVATYGDIWAINKPVGLTVQPGTDHTDSVATRLVAHFPELLFKPTPAHRLDRDTTGLLLVCASYASLATLHADIRAGLVHKEYFAWVSGVWQDGEKMLKGYLRKEGGPGGTKMRYHSEAIPHAKEACCVIRPIRIEENVSLLQIRLLTGRTHQIRCQLAACGHPVLGDGKYGTSRDHQPLMLHAGRIILADGHEFALAPGWRGSFAMPVLPPPIMIS